MGILQRLEVAQPPGSHGQMFLKAILLLLISAHGNFLTIIPTERRFASGTA